MDYKPLAKDILNKVGGESNVKNVTHCMTRLRFELKDENLAKKAELEDIGLVKGIMQQSGQYQIIIGSEVANVYQALPESIKNENPDDSNLNESLKTNHSIKQIFNRILDYLSASITGAIGVIIGSGMIKLLLVILDLFSVHHGTTYNILSIIGDTGFYFLPLILAYTSAKKLKVDPAISIVVSAFLIHPQLIELLTKSNVTFLGIPVYSTNYAAGIIPPLLATWLLSIVFRMVDKITPNWSKAILNNMLALLITIPLVLLFFAPLGSIIGTGLSTITNLITQYVPWLTMGITAAFLPLLVIAGIHHAFDPLYISSFAKVGYDALFLPMMLAMNFAITASLIVVGLKSKAKKDESIAFSSAISSGLAGITEPGLFGVLLKRKRALAGTMIGSGFGGSVVGLLHVKIFAAVSPGMIAMISFISKKYPNNIIMAIIAAIVSFIVSFVATWLLERNSFDTESNKASKEKHSFNIHQPIKGKKIPLSKVNDATFSEKILGDGAAIIPEEGKVLAPVNGTIQVMYQTGHAIGIKSDGGLEILIHIGLDTVKLGGKGFNPKVSQGQHVKIGDELLDFDLNWVKAQGFDLITPVIITNLNDLDMNLDNSDSKAFIKII